MNHADTEDKLEPGDSVLFESTSATRSWAIDGRFGKVINVQPMGLYQLCLVQVDGEHEPRKVLGIHLSKVPAPPDLIGVASLLCGVGTVLMSAYIAAVRYGVLP